MNHKNPETDSGKYIDGIYTTINGKSGIGLNCPKGTRLYDTSLKRAIFFQPDDIEEGETFEIITQEVAKDILPYYAISNYGRLMNINSGKVMKPNIRPNGYEYYCLAAENSKHGQKKYNTHRLVMKTFNPIDNMDELEVDHVNDIKTDNYINKIMPDGTIQSNLEWVTTRQNIKKSVESGLLIAGKLDKEKAKDIRNLRDQGYSYNQIKEMKYNEVSTKAIQNICQNKTYKDENYIPKTFKDINNLNPAGIHRITDKDVEVIRDLKKHGYKYQEIVDNFYPNFSIATISDICRNKTHNDTRG